MVFAYKNIGSRFRRKTQLGIEGDASKFISGIMAYLTAEIFDFAEEELKD